MKIKPLSILITAILALPPGIRAGVADDVPETPEEAQADEAAAAAADAQTRNEPEMDNSTAGVVVTRSSYGKYPFLNRKANHIQMNGADWSDIARKLDEAEHKHGVVSVVHIGDSHLQPDGNTGQLRKIFQTSYGNAGRGLMSPLRIAHTNAPLDFHITTAAPVTASKLMRRPWPTAMGFTGVGVRPSTSTARFSIDCKSPFECLRIYGSGSFRVSAVTTGGEPTEFSWDTESYGGLLRLDAPVMTLTLTVEGSNYTLFGFDARRQPASENHGVLYHNIGNNGATFGMYSQIPEFTHEISPLSPDLIVLSLGTNEAFGRFSESALWSQIDRLVQSLRISNPQAQILLTTPSECQRTVYSRVYITRRRRGRRRRRSRRVRTYQINANVARVRDVILRYGRENNIPTYDFYAVAGGKGASAHWVSNKLMSGDRIHRTWTGYYLEGELLADAMNLALTKAGLRNPLIPEVEVSAKPEAEVEVKKVTPAKTSKVSKGTKKYKKSKKRKRRRRSRRR